MFARPLIDGSDFARNGKELRGTVALDALPRMGDSLVDSRGEIEFALLGFKDGDRLMLKIDLAGECRLRCQRCLGALAYPVSMSSTLRLMPEGSVDDIDADDEAECLQASSRIDVLSLVEDELLLGIPYAPRHPEGECSTQMNEPEQPASPFAVLSNIGKKQ